MRVSSAPRRAPGPRRVTLWLRGGLWPRCPVCHRRVLGTSACPRDGWLAPEDTMTGQRAEDPPVIAGYQVDKPLGVGGFSTVWQAVRESDGARVALKVGRG